MRFQDLPLGALFSFLPPHVRLDRTQRCRKIASDSYMVTLPQGNVAVARIVSTQTPVFQDGPAEPSDAEHHKGRGRPACPACGHDGFSLHREIRIQQRVELRFTDTLGNYRIERDELGDTVETYPFEDAECQDCGAMVDVALLFPSQVTEETTP